MIDEKTKLINFASSDIEKIPDSKDTEYTERIKMKNWPRFKPILRHDIEDDLPYCVHLLMKILLFDRFFTIFLLILNFANTLIAKEENVTLYYNSVIYTNYVIAPIWLVVWTILTVAVYIGFYKSFAKNNKAIYIFTFGGMVIEIVFSAFAAIGIDYTGLMGYVNISLLDDDIIGSLYIGYIFASLMTANFVFLIVLLILFHGKHNKLENDYEIVIANNLAINEKIGNSDVLPNEVNGRKIQYLSPDAGRNQNSKVKQLNTIPENSLIVISEWKKVDSDLDDSYILYVENDPNRAYWSNAHVAGIINNGLVNPLTQVLTISRLPGGSFVFGVADKE